ncbi:Ger(x)C family spore germination protein [Lederbergia lenta]|uniref:Spore germination protein n=1 Tax=Lederbergia lenta TaxID=1467 RepID=A0A2X4WEP0_LEDLE|nr:Ger(x)C family spore germination protein [Lederbergia lenta]MCM3112985.1 Ger(x)C family spore germination protein [Lederbergia lenta]MEC2326625.1 Ger(x)C family spore germination protein [Lederbergia lenta]SQI61651.1 spore germination protein [Lederbergia lenta]
MKCRMLLLFLLLPLLTGCVQTKIIDEVNLATVAGIDYTEDDQLHLVTLSTHYTPDKEAVDDYFEVIMSKNDDTENQLNRQSSEPVLIGDLDIIVLGKKAAEEGVFPIIDTLQRNPAVGSRLFLVVSEGPMTELLKESYGTQGNATYISKLIEHNMKERDVPETNLHLFVSDFFQKRKGAYLPILKKLPGRHLEVSGLALFHDEKMVYTVPEKDMFYFKIFVDKHTDGNLPVKIDKEMAVVSNIKSHTMINADYNNLTFEIDFQLKGIIKQYTGKKLETEIIERIKDSMERKIEKESLRLLKEFQDMGIDPIGVERKFKQQNRNFDQEKWKDQYKDVTFKFKSVIQILESGTLE